MSYFSKKKKKRRKNMGWLDSQSMDYLRVFKQIFLKHSSVVKSKKHGFTALIKKPYGGGAHERPQ